MPADAGIRFGNFVLLRRIARGGMAEVFLAQQRGLEGFDRRVAVKRILPHLVDSPDFVKMFLGEARLAAQLTHPNIVHIYDFGKVDNDYFIAMEYVDGVHTGQLFKHLERDRLTPTLIARIGADAAAALNYAHELQSPTGERYGLVHRDVSPANIMVSYDGVVKLCDFGIAKAASLTNQLTQPGQVKGKYAYMSPEQTIASALDGRSDVFSLAIVMWELLSGKTIVGRGDAVEAMRSIRDGKLTPISQVAPHTPPALAKALNWALETKRERRATASEFAQALESFIKASPELATPMQLATWVRGRFPRDSTGPQTAIPVQMPGTGMVPKTGAAPGTLAAPGTFAAPASSGLGESKISAVTPARLIPAASVLVDRDTHESPDDTAPTVVLSSDQMRAHQAILDRGARLTQRTTDQQQVTVLDPSAGAPDRPGKSVIVNDTNDGEGETLMRSGAWKAPISSGPAVVPTMIHQQRLEPGMPLATETTMGVRKTSGRKRFVVPIAALVGVAFVTFVIVLAARSPAGVATRDAAVVATTPRDAVVSDAAPDTVAIAIDAPAEPTFRLDAAPGPTTLLEVRTKPGGATIKIGDQTRVAPAQFALSAGKHSVVAELDGWVAERRQIDLLVGDHLVHEIAFTRRVGTVKPPQAKTGRFVARTNPYSDVYEGIRKIAQTPCDIELPAGKHTLLFKNPNHKTVYKTVVIQPGKPVKLSFDLP